MLAQQALLPVWTQVHRDERIRPRYLPARRISNFKSVRGCVSNLELSSALASPERVPVPLRSHPISRPASHSVCTSADACEPLPNNIHRARACPPPLSLVSSRSLSRVSTEIHPLLRVFPDFCHLSRMSRMSRMLSVSVGPGLGRSAIPSVSQFCRTLHGPAACFAVALPVVHCLAQTQVAWPSHMHTPRTRTYKLRQPTLVPHFHLSLISRTAHVWGPRTGFPDFGVF